MTAPRVSRFVLAPRRRCLALLLVATAGVIVKPCEARAHAHLRKSAPAAGATVPPPQAIRLWFTEAPELALTRITMLDSLGVPVTVAAPARDPEGAMGVHVRIVRALTSGVYTVRWTTAAADGHPSSGSFTFRVLAAVDASPVVPPTSTPSQTTARRAAVEAPREADSGGGAAAAVLARAAWLAALVVLLGAVTFRFLILDRTAALDDDLREAARAQLARRALLVCLLFLAATIAKLYLQSRLMSGQAASSASPVRALMMDTRWGTVWRAQLGAGVLTLLGFLLARRRIAGGWPVAAVGAILIAVATALGGHAAAAEHLTSFAVVDDALHVVGASGWLGSLFWVMVAGTAAVHDTGDQPARRVAALVSAFSPVALACAALAALTGVASAWLRLGSVAALWATAYGQVLVLKLALLAIAAAVGYYNWRRLRPSLGSAAATARLHRSATTELIIGAAIVAVTAALVGMPTPVVQ